MSVLRTSNPLLRRCSIHFSQQWQVELLYTLIVSAATGVIEAEVERIWQFLVPLAAVAAAPYATARRWVVLGLAAGLVQAYVIELRWDTTF